MPLLGNSQLSWTHPVLLFLFIFSDSHRWVFFTLLVVFTKTNTSSVSANKQTSDHVLSYQMLYTMFPTVKRPSHSDKTGYQLDTSIRIVHKLPPEQDKGEAYVLVKHRKTLRTGETRQHSRCLKNRLNLGFLNPLIWVPPSTPTALSNDIHRPSPALWSSLISRNYFY